MERPAFLPKNNTAAVTYFYEGACLIETKTLLC